MLKNHYFLAAGIIAVLTMFLSVVYRIGRTENWTTWNLDDNHRISAIYFSRPLSETEINEIEADIIKPKGMDTSGSDIRRYIWNKYNIFAPTLRLMKFSPQSTIYERNYYEAWAIFASILIVVSLLIKGVLKQASTS